MKIILADQTEIVINNMSQNLYRASDEGEQIKSIRLDVPKENIDVDNIETTFSNQNLASFQFVNNEDTISYSNYKLLDANIYMDNERTAVSVTIAPIA